MSTIAIYEGLEQANAIIMEARMKSQNSGPALTLLRHAAGHIEKEMSAILAS